MKATRKLWTWLAIICVLSFAVLGWVAERAVLIKEGGHDFPLEA